MPKRAILVLVLAFLATGASVTRWSGDVPSQAPHEPLPAEIPALAALMHGDDGIRGEEATDLLGTKLRSDATAVDAIEAALAPDSPEHVRARAARQLFRAFETPPETTTRLVSAILTAVEDPDPDVRREAATAVDALRFRRPDTVDDERFVDALARALEISDDTLARASAYDALVGFRVAEGPHRWKAKQLLRENVSEADLKTLPLGRVMHSPRLPLPTEAFLLLSDPAAPDADRLSAIAVLARELKFSSGQDEERLTRALLRTVEDPDPRISVAADDALSALLPSRPALEPRLRAAHAAARAAPHSFPRPVPITDVPSELRSNLRHNLNVLQNGRHANDGWGTDLVDLGFVPVGESPSSGPLYAYGFCRPNRGASAEEGSDPTRMSTLDPRVETALPPRARLAAANREMADPCASLPDAKSFTAWGLSMKAWAARNRDADPAVELWTYENGRFVQISED